MKLNKIFTGACAFVILSLFFSCASTDDGVKEVVFDSADVNAPAEDEPVEEQEITDDNTLLVTSDDASTYQIEAVAPAGRDNKKNYTGWIATSVKPITNEIGNIKLFARPKKGTFSISVLNEAGKAIPVLSTANEYNTTSFYLKAGRKVVKLCDDSSVVSAAKKTEKGIKLRYSIDKVAVVIIDFECFSSVEGEPEDSIKITSAIVSQSKKKTDFSLKLIMDTILGETDRHHFYTSQELPVKNEVLYHSIEDEKWFTSKNSKASMQIILAGGECTPLESVALANFATLDTKKWEADMTTFRSFDTVLSYNNSAVGLYWPKVSLQTDEQAKNVFYISFATGEAVPGGAAYINKLAEEAEQTEQEKEEKSDAAFEEKPLKETAVQNIEAVKEPEKKTPVTEKPVTTTEPVKEESKPQSVAAVEEKAEPKDNGITSEKLSSDYIQKLIERIEQLEENDPDLNKAEINDLNLELDAIITILNARNSQ